MLDNITKKNIDDCRDVLVGKVPDPKSQIEQITLALIYKFMDDMDKEAVEKFKGKAKFFTGEYAKYGWRKLFDPSLSGQDMLSLYSEALEKLNTNPNIPELFRNIFKNAYLPYRDPATLKLFLKHINEFEYSHSEKLGDAFEYLLSVMGSQGDAGQFRTPRHIIDFVTACVNPQKNETVLDPACGTAGFLLSAYKHILNQNTEKRLGDKLKPDDRKKLATNFVGYDISPDMVRLSLVNMYLHGFATPQIHEYDTLSSEDRWQETFDVILANPPFMTPKGGIRPHKKFGVQANKAEVLFTDYIAEHLNSNGRAGIVVPNGIVATSQTAYKQLRKMLVQDSLIAVISLPAGVFQPYSGVKTSVLILDKKLAKKSQHILFLKIENDGFDLGAQRREIDKNDLPLALQTLEAYKECLSNDEVFGDLPSLATLVERETVINNKDVGLNADRYFENEIRQSNYELVKLGEVIDLIMGQAPAGDECNKDGIGTPFVKVGQFGEIKPNIDEWTTKPLKMAKEGDVLICVVGATIGKLNLGIECAIGRSVAAIRPDKTRLEQIYLYHLLKEWTLKLREQSQGSAQGVIGKDILNEIEIPLPPLEVQQQIVAEIEGYQKIIDGAKQIVNNYKPTIKINPDWEMVELGEVCEITSSKRIFQEEYVSEGIPFYRSKEVIELSKGLDIKTELYISEKRYNEIKSKFNVPKKGDILLTAVGTIGVTYVIPDDTPFYFKDGNLVWLKEFKAHNSYFLKILLSQRIKEEFIHLADGAAYNALTIDKLKGLMVSRPSLEEQKVIIQAIEEEMLLVNSNKRLIEIFEQKIKDKISEVWGLKAEVEAAI